MLRYRRILGPQTGNDPSYTTGLKGDGLVAIFEAHVRAIKTFDFTGMFIGLSLRLEFSEVLSTSELC